MTIPSTGSITTADIAAEVGGYPFDIPSAVIRTLVGRPAGNITMPDDFYGQTGGGLCTIVGGSTGQTVAGTVTIGGVSFGGIAWNRRVFLCVHWACTTSAVETSVTAGTIGGIAADVHVTNGEGGTSATSNYGCAIISATVPIGTSGTITVTFSNATVRNVLVTSYRVTGLVSAAPTNNANAFDETVGAGTASAQALLTVPSAGLAFFAATASAATSIGNMSTTGVSEAVENSLVSDGRTSSGFQMGLSSQSNRPVTTSCAVDPTGRLRLSCSSFQLA